MMAVLDPGGDEPDDPVMPTGVEDHERRLRPGRLCPGRGRPRGGHARAGLEDLVRPELMLRHVEEMEGMSASARIRR